MSIIGKCPYCNGTVLSKKISYKNKKINLYFCEHAKKEYDESDAFVFTADSTCTFMVYSNSFSRWNKPNFGVLEMRKLLEEKEIIVKLNSKKSKIDYFKYAVLNHEYGVSILWDRDVENSRQKE